MRMSRPRPRSEEEPGEIEPLTPENIERMLHERAPFFLDPDEPATDSELEAVESDDTLPPAADREPPADASADPRVRRAQERAKRRRDGQRRLLMLILALVVLIVVIVVLTSGSSSPPAPSTAGGSKAAHQGKGPSYLSVPTDPSAVPQNILIADRNNSRILSISPKGQIVWTHPVSAPSDAYLSYTGHTAVITQHTKSRIFTLEIDPGIVNYIYGHSDKAGSADNYLHDPQTAQEMPSGGQIVIADLGNCRIIFVRPNKHVPIHSLGGSATDCVHHVLSAPYSFSKPDAAFPSFDGNGDLVVTELSPAWVDVFDKSLKLLDQIKLSGAGFTAPYDANEYAPGDLIVVDRTTPRRGRGVHRHRHAAVALRHRLGRRRAQPPDARAGAARRQRARRRLGQRSRDRDRPRLEEDHLAVRAHRQAGRRARLPAHARQRGARPAFLGTAFRMRARPAAARMAALDRHPAPCP